MKFSEDEFYLLEIPLFEPIAQECDLWLSMGEDDIADYCYLHKILEITDTIISDSNDATFIKLATEFKTLVEKAIEFKTAIYFLF